MNKLKELGLGIIFLSQVALNSNTIEHKTFGSYGKNPNSPDTLKIEQKIDLDNYRINFDSLFNNKNFYLRSNDSKKSLENILKIDKSLDSLSLNDYLSVIHYDVKPEFIERVSKLVDKVYSEVPLNDFFDKRFVMTLIGYESKYNENAVSYVGARGLMQIMPGTWSTFNKSASFYGNSSNPEENLKTGFKILNWLHDYAQTNDKHWSDKNDIERKMTIIAMYNAGQGILPVLNPKLDNRNISGETRRFMDKIHDSEIIYKNMDQKIENYIDVSSFYSFPKS